VLSPLDDHPIHQIAEPIRYVGTSDRNFYDRYYFNCFPVGGALMLAFGLGQYPNLGVTDAFVTVTFDGRHRIVRASRELGLDRMDTAIGPLRVDVVEGLRRLRITCDPAAGSAGPEVAFDLLWSADAGPIEEPRHFSRKDGRVLVDTIRLGQTGHWSGSLHVAGHDFEVTEDSWHGFRDRSWGVRPVGEAEPAGIRAAREFGTFYWLYAAMQFDEFSVFTGIHEDSQGNRRREYALRVAGSAEPTPLGRVEQKLEFRPGTRQVAAATLTFHPPGEAPSVVRVEPVRPLYVSAGTGYGLDADWRHGSYRGPLVVEELTMTDGEARDVGGVYAVVEALSRYRYEGPDGAATGWGMFEYSVIGPHAPSGFTGVSDVAS
jgi:hypothetical protein